MRKQMRGITDWRCLRMIQYEQMMQQKNWRIFADSLEEWINIRKLKMEASKIKVVAFEKRHS